MKSGIWINEPKKWEIEEDSILIYTDPKTDFWQRTYYGFRNNNAHAYLWREDKNFTFSARVNFHYNSLFDQSGIIIYLNEENWFKASVEYENSNLSRLGSVVTNSGQSDWATTDIQSLHEIWFKLSRRGPDFLAEYALDGKYYHQMRIFHLMELGGTSDSMGKLKALDIPAEIVPIGVYACSPMETSFPATFSEIDFRESSWLAHKN